MFLTSILFTRFRGTRTNVITHDATNQSVSRTEPEGLNPALPKGPNELLLRYWRPQRSSTWLCNYFEFIEHANEFTKKSIIKSSRLIYIYTFKCLYIEHNCKYIYTHSIVIHQKRSLILAHISFEACNLAQSKLDTCI